MLRVALAVTALIVAILVGGQIALPRAAERRIADELEGSGEVERVSVSAVPAVKLLFGRADRVELRMGEAQAGTGRLAKLLRDARGVGELDARIELLRVGPLRLSNVMFTKEDERLAADAQVSRADLHSALPPRLDVQPVPTDDGDLVLEGTVGPLTARARLSARDGALVIAPEGPLGAIGSLTVFRDRRVLVDEVGADVAPGGWMLSARGRLGD